MSNSGYNTYIAGGMKMEMDSTLVYQSIREKVVAFILANFLFGDTERIPTDDESLLQTGVVDSTGILELIEFVEQEFGFHVLDTETVPENLDGVANVVRFVLRKRSDLETSANR